VKRAGLLLAVGLCVSGCANKAAPGVQFSECYYDYGRLTVPLVISGGSSGCEISSVFLPPAFEPLDVPMPCAVGVHGHVVYQLIIHPDRITEWRDQVVHVQLSGRELVGLDPKQIGWRWPQ
jgi:hypothetical protein